MFRADIQDIDKAIKISVFRFLILKLISPFDAQIPSAPGHETAPFEPSSQTYRENHFIICMTAPGHETALFECSSQT